MPPSLKKKVLIVEDEKPMRTALVDKFLKNGFEVFEARDGKSGLKTARAKKPDIIIVDIVMPQMDGFAMMRRIRKDAPWGERVPIIILTNLNTADILTKRVMKEELTSPLMLKAETKLEDLFKEVRKQLGLQK